MAYRVSFALVSAPSLAHPPLCFAASIARAAAFECRKERKAEGSGHGSWTQAGEFRRVGQLFPLISRPGGSVTRRARATATGSALLRTPVL